MRLVPFVAALGGCELLADIRHGGYDNDCIWVDFSDAYFDCGDVEYCENVRGEGMYFDLNGRRYNCEENAHDCLRMACNTCGMSPADRDFFCDPFN